MSRKYTDEELITELHRFVRENGRVPRLIEMCGKNGYPNGSTFILHFDSWNNAIIAAGYKVNKEPIDNNRICSICGTMNTIYWVYDKNKNFVCSNCCKHERHHIRGTLDPNSYVGIGLITEVIVANVLKCKKCNIGDNFNSEYDLISEKYGNIDVKSSTLKKYNGHNECWSFTKSSEFETPDYFICVGFDKNRTEIQHVWFIPGNSEMIVKWNINISISNLKRVKLYEVDSTPYNKEYQNLDIYSLPEFRNLNTEGVCG